MEADIFARIGKPGRRELSHIPGKKGLPYLGILPEAVMDPLGFGERMYARHGRVYCFYALGSWNVQIVGAGSQRTRPVRSRQHLFRPRRLGARHRPLLPRGAPDAGR
jgi:hypothetical protein